MEPRSGGGGAGSTSPACELRDEGVVAVQAADGYWGAVLAGAVVDEQDGGGDLRRDGMPDGALDVVQSEVALGLCFELVD